jgi:predicted HAD superfamily Cof-like phosphohydrolase
MEGFECLEDITSKHPDIFEKAQVFEALKGNTPQRNPLAQQIEHMKLRARFNPQRRYEIYVFTTEDTVEFKNIEDWMIADPQGLVNWIRKNHYAKIYSDHSPHHKPVIV